MDIQPIADIVLHNGPSAVIAGGALMAMLRKLQDNDKSQDKKLSAQNNKLDAIIEQNRILKEQLMLWGERLAVLSATVEATKERFELATGAHRSQLDTLNERTIRMDERLKIVERVK